ncbi:hypothetical protein ACPW96_08145 [Micromonospora sp. DT81.3]
MRWPETTSFRQFDDLALWGIRSERVEEDGAELAAEETYAVA